MIFDEYFYRLTGGRGIDGQEVIQGRDSFNKGADGLDAVLGLKHVGSSSELPEYGESYDEAPRSYKDPSLDYSKDDYVIESDLVTPKTNIAQKNTDKPAILVIDDDFPTLDILKIYLMRDYAYTAFSSAKEGLLFLHENVVDLILFDCRIHTTPSEKVVGMIKSFPHCKDVPIIYVGDEYDLASLNGILPAGVCDTLKRPVARGDLQIILDKYMKKKEQSETA